MSRTTTPQSAAKKIAEAVIALVKLEFSRSTAVKARLKAVNTMRGVTTHTLKRKLSPKVLRQRRLQGRFMGLIRLLPSAKKAAIKKLRLEKGYPAAIAAARKARNAV